MFDQAFAGLIAKAGNAYGAEPPRGDYDGPDGLRRCGRCHQPRQMRLDVPLVGMRTVYVMCECEKARQEAEAARQAATERQMRVNELRANGILNRDHLGMTFAADDGSDPRMTTIATNYAENWREVRTLDAPGLLLTGGVGGGKTFWACCIANALIDRGYSAMVTTIPALVAAMSTNGFERDKQKVLANVAAVDLLVLDDIGFERTSPYAHEKMHEIIDARYLAKRPLIVTTNLSFTDMEKPELMEYKRVFDRIIGMTRPIHVKADGRRKRIAQESSRRMDALLGL